MSKGDPVSRAYGFNYDNANRLLKGDFTQNESGGYVKDAQVDFNVDSLHYDANGNLLHMQQKGLIINSSSVIDYLQYSYLQTGQWSNKLASVSDSSKSPTPLGDFKDGTNTGNDYAYDGNGNLTVDSNKNMNIAYNILNLAQRIAIRGKGTISYVYDAVGNKLKKIVIDSTITPVETTTTTYSGPFVYNNDSLQFIGHEEGRTRTKLINPSLGWAPTNIEYVYDYFIKDHLGDTRMVLSEETEQDTYAATMETQNSQVENELFDSINSTRIAKPAGFDTDTSNHYVSGLNASSSVNLRIGPTIILKVMAGDSVSASTYAWYSGAVQAPSGPSLLNSLVPMLATGSIGASAGHLALSEQSSLNSVLDNNLPAFLSYKDGQYNSASPKAFLNWAFFDDRFNYVEGGVTQVPVITGGEYKQVLTANLPMTMPKNGYLYIYVSNESPQYVYFDNVTIQDHRGPLLEETHYYPFGLPQSGISDQAIKSNYAQNKHKYNDKELQSNEFSDGTSLQEYDFGARFQDPQLGVWHGIDPLAETNSHWSPYIYGLDNPIRNIDPDGMEDEDAVVGADGLTDEQWMEASAPDADPNLRRSYQEANRQGKVAQAKFKAMEKKFYDTWDNGTAESDPNKRAAIYEKAFRDLYEDFSMEFGAMASANQFFFRFGGSRGQTNEAMQTDPETVSKYGSEGTEHPDRVGKVGIQVFDETIKAISSRKWSFGWIVRAFFHEAIHVRQVFHPFDVYFNQTSVFELTAYYISSINQNLPPMSQDEATTNAANAIYNFTAYIVPDKRPAAYKMYKEKIDYFLGVLGPELAKKVRKEYKF
jgi:RHS repeat-associated protein